MKEVLEPLRICLTIGTGEKGPGIEQGDLFVAPDEVGVEAVQRLHLLLRPRLLRRARKDLTQHHRHLRIVSLDRREDEFHILRRHRGLEPDLEIVRTHQQDDGRGIQSQNIVEPDEHAARRVATDAAIGAFHSRKAARQARAPALRDRITEKDDALLIRLHFRRPLRPQLGPAFHEPLVAAQRTNAGQGSLDLHRRKGQTIVLTRNRQNEKAKSEKPGGLHGASG